MYLKFRLSLLAVYLLLLAACNISTQKEKKTVFSKLSATESGIDFNNVISENDSVNLINNEYAYMGSGVGIIDINNDGFGCSSQAVFLDFDKDVDLDMYLVNHLLQGSNPNNITRKDLSGHFYSTIICI